MRKKLKIVVATLALLTAVYYGYTSYKKTEAYLHVVHENADAVLKIGIQDIKEALIVDAITSPSFYYGNLGSTKDGGEQNDDNTGSINWTPYNLIAFKMPSIEKTWFATFTVTDEESVHVFLDKNFKGKYTIPKEVKEYKRASLYDKKVNFAWNAEKLVVAVSINTLTNTIESVFSDVLIKNKTISERNHPLLKAVKKETSHLVFADKKNRLNIDFKDGAIVLNGVLDTDADEKLDKTTSISFPKASLAFHLKTEINEEKREKWAEYLESFSFFRDNQLEVTKILDGTNGEFNLSIAGTTSQSDTIITYTYDDNFEKIEQKAVQEKEVPYLHFSFGLGKKELKRYLSEIEAIDSNQLFKPFPLYQLYVQDDDYYTHFSTSSKKLVTKRENNTNFLEATVNFERLQKDLSIQKTEAIFMLLDKMDIQANQSGKGIAKINGTVTGKQENINILSQLYFGLKNTSKNESSKVDL